MCHVAQFQFEGYQFQFQFIQSVETDFLEKNLVYFADVTAEFSTTAFCLLLRIVPQWAWPCRLWSCGGVDVVELVDP